MRRKAQIVRTPEVVLVFAPYHPEFVARVKAIPSAFRRWFPEGAFWAIHPDHAGAAIEAARGCFGKVEEMRLDEVPARFLFNFRREVIGMVLETGEEVVFAPERREKWEEEVEEILRKEGF